MNLKMINFSILIAFAQSGSQPSHEYFSRIVQDIKGQEASPRHGKPRGEAYLPTDYIRLFLPSNSDIDPCSNATKLECGVVFPPYCMFACAWNISIQVCQSVDNYPLPRNDSLTKLVSASSPLLLPNGNYTTISFYGDSITWLNVYEPIIAEAISNSQFTSDIPVRIINQGVNGGTIKDLVKGFSPWGHLNPNYPQTNITFAETLDQDKPDIVHIQIGINDILQAGPNCGIRCSNVSEYVRVFIEDIASPLISRNISFVIVSVSTIGEFPDGQNINDELLDAFASAQKDLAASLAVPFVNLRSEDELYESLNNCLPVKSGILTYDGIHPLEPRGSMNLANLHSEGLIQALEESSLRPKPLPLPYGGRIFVTNLSYELNLTISGADAACTTEAKEPSKAILVDEFGCEDKPCRRASKSPFAGDEQIDWPLKASSSYYRFDGNSSLVLFTNSNSLFEFPFWTSLFKCFNQASGFNSDFTTKVNATCESWTKQTSNSTQGVGWICSRDDDFLNGGNLDCSIPNKFICVTLN